MSRTLAIGLMFALIAAAFPSQAHAQGDVVVRIQDTTGSHCIDATSEKVTVFLRRVFLQKRSGVFTEDKRAGVLIRTQLVGRDIKNTEDDIPVQIPSVGLVSVKDDPSGRVSLALEYPIASAFSLTQGTRLTKSMELHVNLAKAKGKTSFGAVLDLAGQALSQVSLPANPFLQAGSKFLKFSNDAVNGSIAADQDEQIAHVALQFNEGKEDDLAHCAAAGNERTGAVAVLRSMGVGTDLIPVTNTQAQYCFSYSSQSTYELLAAKRNQDGSCPAPGAAYRGVPNDYMMLLISAQPVPKGSTRAASGPQDKALEESKSRCERYGLKPSACGL